jgi:hypothetical protein
MHMPVCDIRQSSAIGQGNTANGKLITEMLPYPCATFMKYVYKLPIILYRLGPGTLVGQLFMVMTTPWRKKAAMTMCV